MYRIKRMEHNNDILSKLKFISRIQKGEKINVNGLYIQTEGYATTISRTFVRPESRQQTLSFLQTTIEKSIELIREYISSENYAKNLSSLNIIDDLTESKKGVNNLKTTYSEDIMFGCNMDSLIQNIDIEISDIKRAHSDIFDNTVEVNE